MPLGTNGCMPDRKRARQQLSDAVRHSHNDRFLLYPVRAIRRKNLGEALLWSVLGGPTVHVGVTLAPENPAEQPYYRAMETSGPRVCSCTSTSKLGARSGLPLDENLASADLTLTTSVTEGFGMAFLESWVAERALVGRDLPEITADFAAAGTATGPPVPQAQDPAGPDWPRPTFHDMLQTCVQRGCSRRTAGRPSRWQESGLHDGRATPGRCRRLRGSG